MKKLSQIGGIIGIVLLALAGTVGLIQQDLTIISLIHLVLGSVLLILSLIINLKEVREFLSKGGMRMGPQIAIQGVLIVLMRLFVNIIIYRHDYIKDFTNKRLFTLRPQSRTTIKNLPGKVDVMAFFPGGSFNETRQRLRIYGIYPKVSLRIIDPDKNEDVAQAENIPREPGVLFKYQGERVWINKYNEQDITNALIKVTRDTRPTVWFSMGHGEPALKSTDPNGLSYLHRMLTDQGYQVETVDLRAKEKIPDEVSMVALIGPNTQLIENEIRILDDYLVRGGDAIICLDPVFSAEEVTGMERFLGPYGVRAQWNIVRDPESRLADDKTGTWIISKNISSKHPVTEGLTQPSLVFYRTRSLTISQSLGPRLSVTPLAQSSSQSFAKYVDPNLFSRMKTQQEKQQFMKSIFEEKGDADARQKHVLAMAINKKPPQKKAWLKEDEVPSEMRIVVTGTSAICRNISISIPYNWEFVMNSFNWLAGEEDLKHIKTRQRGGNRIYLSRAQKNGILYISVMIIPEIFMIIGLAVWWRRR